ncbi:histone H4-like TAF Taf6, SAGA complex subunit [Malassezia sp. CBS 17886]|nr:histone H4-like TAF Taf6, SAGA complex subunit [Malassezia sp. CBS 17886]
MSFNDLERGHHGADERSAPYGEQGAHHALGMGHVGGSAAESPAFIELTESVGLHVFRINANVATLQKLEGRLRKGSDGVGSSSDELSTQFNDLSEQTRGIVKDATDDVKALSRFPLPGAPGRHTLRSSPSRLMQAKLQRDFQQALAAFQSVQKSGVQKEKEALAYARTHVSPQAAALSPSAEMQLMDVDHSERAPAARGDMQAQTTAPRISQAEIEFQESLIAEREAEIREIESGVQELNDIFRDLSHIVQEQGGMIDNIEYNISSLASNVQGADRELFQAHSYQRRAGRRTLCLIIIVGFVVAVVLLAHPCSVHSMSSATGNKRGGSGTSFSSNSAAAFGPSIPSSVYPKDSVKDVAEALGIMNLRDNVAVALATDIEYRIRDIVQSAAKYMKHAKRTQLTTMDVDSALRQKNIEPLYGFFPPYTTGKSRGPWFRSAPTASGAPVYTMEDEEIDFDQVLETGPRVGVGRGVGWHAHWLAIEGIQPSVPENPASLSRQYANADGTVPDAGEAAAELGSTAVKPLVKHVLSRELQLYYERLTSSIINPPADTKSEPAHVLDDPAAADKLGGATLAGFAGSACGNAVRDAALASLRGDSGIHQLVPYLIQWIGANVTHALRQAHGGAEEEFTPSAAKTADLLRIMLGTLHALLVNPSIFIEPYLHQLMPSLLSIMLASYLDADAPSPSSAFESSAVQLREYAASLLAHVLDRYADSYPTLRARVVATLIQALYANMDLGPATSMPQASGSLDAKLGALLALRTLGPASFKTILGSVAVLPPLLPDGDADGDADGKADPSVAPLRAMGVWLQRLAAEGDAAPPRARILGPMILDQVHGGLHDLGLASAPDAQSVPDESTVRELEAVYGPYWTQDNLDAPALRAMAHYRSLAATK